MTTGCAPTFRRFSISSPGFTVALVRSQLRGLLAQVRGSGDAPVVFKVDGRHVFLRADEIDFVEASGKEVHVHVGATVYQVRESMNSVESRLDQTRFIRVHRGTIVNTSRIREMQPWFQGEFVLILRDGRRVVTGRSYREAVVRLTRPAPRAR